MTGWCQQRNKGKLLHSLGFVLDADFAACGGKVRIQHKEWMSRRRRRGDSNSYNLAGKCTLACLVISEEDEIILGQVVLSQVRTWLCDLLSNQIVPSNLKGDVVFRRREDNANPPGAIKRTGLAVRGVVDLDRYRMRCIRSRYNNPIHISFLQRLGSSSARTCLCGCVNAKIGHS